MRRQFATATAEVLDALPGHMGVFELADDHDDVRFIGYAGGRSLFGLRGEIRGRLGETGATRFRYEITTAYLTRYQERLMQYVARRGGLPPDNDVASVGRLGRLSPGLSQG